MSPTARETPRRILVTGAAGKTGRAVLRALAERGATARALIHRPEHEASVRAAGAAEVAHGDLENPRALAAAAAGVDGAYLICPNMCHAEVAIGRAALEAAAAAATERFVYHSVLHPQTEAMPHHWRKLRVEELVLASGLAYTILQPAAYMQNVLAERDGILRKGVFRVPYPVATRLALVDLADVAEAAAVVLTEPGHAGATYELCGEPDWDQARIAEALARVCGRKVRATERSLADWQASPPATGLAPAVRDDLVAMFEYYARHGLAGNSNVLRGLLGREPTGFDEFAVRELGGIG